MQTDIKTALDDDTTDWRFAETGIRVGQIVAVNPAGKALVDFPGNPSGPIFARSILPSAHGANPRDLIGESVLLVFANHDLALPIVVGFVHNALFVEAPRQNFGASSDNSQEIVVDGAKRIAIHGKEEIVLRCGKSSLTLRRDGKVLVKGKDIVSCASGRQRIKGGSVAIN